MGSLARATVHAAVDASDEVEEAVEVSTPGPLYLSRRLLRRLLWGARNLGHSGPLYLSRRLLRKLLGGVPPPKAEPLRAPYPGGRLLRRLLPQGPTLAPPPKAAVAPPPKAALGYLNEWGGVGASSEGWAAPGPFPPGRHLRWQPKRLLRRQLMTRACLGVISLFNPPPSKLAPASRLARAPYASSPSGLLSPLEDAEPGLSGSMRRASASVELPGRQHLAQTLS